MKNQSKNVSKFADNKNLNDYENLKKEIGFEEKDIPIEDYLKQIMKAKDNHGISRKNKNSRTRKR